MAIRKEEEMNGLPVFDATPYNMLLNQGVGTQMSTSLGMGSPMGMPLHGFETGLDHGSLATWKRCQEDSMRWTMAPCDQGRDHFLKIQALELAYRSPSFRETPLRNSGLIETKPTDFFAEMEQRHREMEMNERVARDAAAAEFIKSVFEIAPIVEKTGKETVFGGYGNSHFSYIEDKGFHVTTAVPGFGKKEGFTNGLSLHDKLY